jgi:hypothetical protein
MRGITKIPVEMFFHYFNKILEKKKKKLKKNIKYIFAF